MHKIMLRYTCTFFKCKTVAFLCDSYLFEGAASMKKIKKNKSMFDELLNAMDMVGFLDEVHYQQLFHFPLLHTCSSSMIIISF